MNKGNFGSGIIGFILGVLSLGLFAFFKRKKDERSNDPIEHDPCTGEPIESEDE